MGGFVIHVHATLTTSLMLSVQWGSICYEQDNWASPTCEGYCLPTRLRTDTGYQLVPLGNRDIDKSQNMQHPVCLLNTITTTSPVEISGGELGRTRVEGSSVAELERGSVVFLVVCSRAVTGMKAGGVWSSPMPRTECWASSH